MISSLVVGPNYQSGQIYHAPANQIIWNPVQFSSFFLFEIHIEITKPQDQVILMEKNTIESIGSDEGLLLPIIRP